MPAATDTLVGKATTDTLTNKTLTNPTINAAALSGTLSGTPTFSGVTTHSALDVFNAGISVKNGSTSAGFIELYEDSTNGTNKATLIGPASTGDVTITLPAATDTLVGKATTDTLTNKTLTSPTITGTGAIAGTFTGDITGDVTGNADTATKIASITNSDIVQLTTTQTLTNKTLTNATLTSAVLNTGISGTAIKDEDDMASNSATHLATQQSIKAYVDSVASGLDVRKSVRVATIGNITLSGTQTIDGVALNADDRVLVKGQTDASQNGIYTVAGGTWSRASDANVSSKVTAGMFMFVEEGNTNADNGFVLTTNDTITLDTTDLSFTQFSGAGQITAGTGLSKSGNTLTVDASQTHITAVGTITTGNWQGTPVADAYVANDLTISNGTINNTSIGATTASTGKFTSVTVDDIVLDSKVITMTGSTNDTAVFTVGTNGALSIVTTDTAGADANISIIADGTAELAGTTVTLNSSGGITLDADNGTITFSDGGVSLGTITNAGFTGDIIGNASGSAATVTGAAQTAITSVGTLTGLTVNGDVTISDGTNDFNIASHDGTNGLKLAGTLVTTSAAELNIMDGSTSATATTIVDADRVVLNDNGTMKQVAVTDLKTYVGAEAGAFSIANLDIDGGTDIGAALVDADLIVVDDGAGGTNRKCALSRACCRCNVNNSCSNRYY